MMGLVPLLEETLKDDAVSLSAHKHVRTQQEDENQETGAHQTLDLLAP